MAFVTTNNVRVSGVAASIPDQIVPNRSIDQINKDELGLLIQSTGIENRRIANKQTSESLSLAAANKLIDDLGWDKTEIEILIFVTQTPFQAIPGSSAKLQNDLGLSTNCIAFDINLGCSGYVYGLSTIASMMEAGKLKKGLLLVGDVISKELNPNDMSTVPIFSDAGSATALEFGENESPIFFNLQTDGKGFNVIHQPKGGMMKMDGPAVFNFGLKEVAKNIHLLLSESGKTVEQIDYLVLHQANKLLNEGIRRRMKLPIEKVPYSIGNYGNTSCATIPVTLVDRLRSELRSKKNQLVLAGFGVGLSWGSVVLTVDNIVCPEMIVVK